MPGQSWKGPLPELTAEESALSATLRRDVHHLAGKIGIRNYQRLSKLNEAADYIGARLRESNLKIRRETYTAQGLEFVNVEGEIRGTTRPDEIVVIGAHYDSVIGCPGANDNGSGVAGVLALAPHIVNPERTYRFVGFTNEEPHFFQTDDMGSSVYARGCKERNEKIVAMISLETIGCYFDGEGTQQYPKPLSWFYPSRGNFIAFVGNIASRHLVRASVKTFRETAKFPSEAAALPGFVPGVGWSDHWSFWQEGFPAVMVTDTAIFRYPQYHTAQDTPEKLDYDRCARVVRGLQDVIARI